MATKAKKADKGDKPAKQVTKKTEEKEAVKSAQGAEVTSKATVRKAKENQKLIDEQRTPLGPDAEFTVVTTVKIDGKTHEIGATITRPDSKGTRRLVENGALKAV